MSSEMSIFNDTECADVNGECHYIEEMTLNHFLTVCIVFFGVVSVATNLLTCSISYLCSFSIAD